MTYSKEYTLGLDIGTNSVGWAVLDQDNNLVKKFGHHFWGVRMFEASSDAKERRLNRCNRRRYQRRRERIELLRQLFEKEISKVDSDFFKRLDESFYDEEDSIIKNKNVLDGYLSNSEYNKKYGPTIWHLRKQLLENKDEKIDPRLLYLACHHIIKYRGNFLSQVAEFDVKDSSVLVNSLEAFNEAIRSQKDAYESILKEDQIDGVLKSLVEIENPNDELISKIENIINSKEIIINGEKIENRTKTDKKKNLVTLLNTKGTIIESLFVELLVNGTCNFGKMKIFNSFGEKPDVKIDFGVDNFDEFIQQAISDNPNEYNLFLAATSVKNIFERFYLKKLIGDNKYISFAMVQKFNKYKNDLSTLKRLFKKYLPNKYTEYFRELNDKYDNYVAYTGSTNYRSNKSNKQMKKTTKRISEDKFTTQLIKELNEIASIIQKECPENTKDLLLIDDIKERIGENDFLQRIRSKHNGALPYQLHEVELKQILSNQSKFYPFLSEGEPTTIEKIQLLLKFKRPYFIGPIAGHGDNKWAIFKEGKENERAYPWNFEDIIDFDASATEFIRRMQNKCTYLKGDEDYCLPKYSIIYQAYNVFNFVNKIKVNGGDIDKDTKEKVLDLFLKNKTVTPKRIAKTIDPINQDGVLITDCNVSLSSFVTFNFVPEFAGKVGENIDLIEEIIESITLFEDKTMLEKRIKETFKKYNFEVSEDSLKKIKGFNFKGYGRLSKRLLLGIPFYNVKTGESYNSLMDALHSTTYNFMQIFNAEELTFQKEIEEYNKENSSLYKLDDSEENFDDYVKNNLMISPIWMRPFIQAYKIIQEVEKILGQKISYFAIECTREEDIKNKKQRTIQRKDKISQLLNSVKELKDELSFNSINLSKLKNELKDKENLNEDKLFLYFQQCGKDMYTLEDIDLNDLNSYDIDHIYPQSLLKDDSISNRVLTKRSVNNYKQNILLPTLAQRGFLPKKAYKFYEFLYKNEFISKKKYERLTEKEVDEVAINDFVARQKTATDQAVKALIEALKTFKGIDITHIIYSKASIVSDFRKTNNIYKSREANNFHHAHDAYLNAFLGKTVQFYFNAIGTFFNKDYKPDDFFEGDKDDAQYTRNISKILGPKIRRLATDYSIVWNGLKDIDKIKRTIQTNFDIRETRHTFRKNVFISQVTNGGKNGKANVPIKSKTPNGNDFEMTKYGGYGSPAYMYMQIFECIDKKGNISYRLIPINKLYFVDKNTYLKERLPKNCSFKCVNDDLMINFNSIFEVGKKAYRITGASGDQFLVLNNKERIFKSSVYNAIYTIIKMNNRLNDKRIPEESKRYFIKENNELCSVIYENKEDKNRKFLLRTSQLKAVYKDLISKTSLECYQYESIKNAFDNISTRIETLNLDSEEGFKILFNAVISMISVLKVNERNSINLTKLYSKEELETFKHNKIKISANAAVLTSGSELKQGTKIYSYSPTGFYRKLLFEVK